MMKFLSNMAINIPSKLAKLCWILEYKLTYLASGVSIFESNSVEGTD